MSTAEWLGMVAIELERVAGYTEKIWLDSNSIRQCPYLPPLHPHKLGDNFKANRPQITTY